MNELKEYLKRELGITDEQYNDLVAKAKEESTLNKNIVLLQTIADDLGMMGVVTLQNDNQLGDLVMSLMVQNNDLATMVMNLQAEVEVLKGN